MSADLLELKHNELRITWDKV